jgi:hypothetical protein
MRQSERLARRGRFSAAQCGNQVGEKLVAQAYVTDQEPMRLITIAGNDRLNNRFMFLGGAAEPVLVVGAIWRKSAIERDRLLFQIVIVRTRVDCFVK